MNYKRNLVIADSSNSPNKRLTSLPLNAVNFLEGGFWNRFQRETLRTALLHGYNENEKNHNIENFRIVAGQKTGTFQGKWFADSDLYKWLEAASLYLIIDNSDKKIKSLVFAAVELITSSQQVDGYINTFFQLNRTVAKWNDMIYGHELYCAGHLFQAAVAHYRATGKTDLLNTAIRFADYINTIFGPDLKQEPCGHPVIEMGLIELYRVTDKKQYLDLAEFFINQRGKGLLGGESHHQDHIPIRKAKRVAGHAVRQLYFLAGATDLYMETGDIPLFKALVRLWNDMTTKRIHITGGVGATPKLRIAKTGDEPYFRGEAFGEDYELPNLHVHNETCAQIASVMWNWRMLLATGELQYADLLEWTLYNGALSGIGMDGSSFFYTNPLTSKGDIERKPWFSVACCPPNIMRTIAGIQNFIATVDQNGVQIHLYDKAVVPVILATIDKEVVNSVHKEQQTSAILNMDSRYPWDGKITISVTAVKNSSFTISLRIPSWCSKAEIYVNGNIYSGKGNDPTPGTYYTLNKLWENGDSIELNLNMIPKFIEANPYIEATRNSVAISRGPLVYCLEGIDQERGVRVIDTQVDVESPLKKSWEKDILNGMIKIEAKGVSCDNSNWEEKIYMYADSEQKISKNVKITAIPYFAWANRDVSDMCVWIPKATKVH
ncbi:MAG: glycoside hydrolase family 127 protein [Bacteroidetes bacterium]|nr:glycoside hydrolase family 127 protein [Bacteroidota bacterium]